MNPISFIVTPFHEKFGVPRQSLLIPEAWGKMSFPKNEFYMEAFRGIEECTHLWIIFGFHQIPEGPFNGLVRPPRFENKLKFGVYATRSPHRPNRLGLSVVEFDRLEMKSDEIVLWVKGVDIVSGSPVFDIKPYVPYTDRIDHAKITSFSEAPRALEVVWLCEEPNEKILIEKVISFDPRPGQDKNSEKIYAVSIAGFNVEFKSVGQHFEIISAIRLP